MHASDTRLAPAGFIRARNTFHRAARYVPAYSKFLAENGIRAESIRTPEDFATVPPVTKKNYLQRYELPELMWHGRIESAAIWSTSSGSSGRPTYWPRGRGAACESIALHSRILRGQFDAGNRTTLMAVGYSMGNWIAGGYTVNAALGLHERGTGLSVVAPGMEAETIRNDIARLGPFYSQVVLAGYPPFVKDVLDRADAAVLGQDLKLVLAGESISEEFRDHLLDRMGKPDRPQDTCLIYGTADAGILGHETPASIAVRRLARTDAALAQRLFGSETDTPTLVEFDPEFRYFENDGARRLLFTTDNVVPLIRYRIGDVGEVLPAAAVAEAVRECGHTLPSATSATGCGFVTVHRREDVATTFHAVKIYPGGIHSALAARELAGLVSGKFVLNRVNNPDHTQTLTLGIELRAGVAPRDADHELLHKLAVDALERSSDEYRRLHAALGADAEPVITVHPFGAQPFDYTIKHRYMGAA